MSTKKVKIILSVIVVVAISVCPSRPLMAGLTPLQFVQGTGISFFSNVVASMLANILTGQLGMAVNTNTPLAATDFTNANVYTAYILVANADGSTDVKSFSSNSASAEVMPEQTVEAVSTQFLGTNAKIGALIDRGIIWDTLSIGSPPTTSLDVNVQSFLPGPPTTQRTTAAGFGLVFANGTFITGGQEKSAIVPVPVPGALILGSLGLGTSLTLMRKRRML